jgi:hypothetical protein
MGHRAGAVASETGKPSAICGKHISAADQSVISCVLRPPELESTREKCENRLKTIVKAESPEPIL